MVLRNGLVMNALVLLVRH